jgi:DNA-binding transcriptional LysR family regulator
MDLHRLKIFYVVAQTLNITQAARLLDMGQSSVSRHIASFEDQLKITLFDRQSKNLQLTDAGHILLKQAPLLLSHIQKLENQLHDAALNPDADVCITTAEMLGAYWLLPLLQSYIQQYPMQSLSIMMDDRLYDLQAREADLAFRFYDTGDPALICEVITHMPIYIYAAPEYLKTYGVIKKLDDLSQHRILTYPAHAAAPFPNHRILEQLCEAHDLPAPIKVLQINSIQSMEKLVLDGTGIAAMPDFIGKQHSHLIQILPEIQIPMIPVYVAYEKFRAETLSIQRIINFISQTYC